QPEDWKIRACREIAKAGADIIVGSHPHVLQPMEVYDGTPILYSLGNFCFGGNTHPPMNTAVYQAIYTIEGGSITDREDVLIPCRVYSGYSNNYQPYIVSNESVKREILDFLHSPVV
ncbi:MAG: CapA family protein, partial [Clostridia bacterium]|nr:CapA family protein [Clostridia bacterium]